MITTASLLDELRAYGADVADAMERLDGDEELYALCLRSFLTDKSFDRLAAAVAAQDADGGFEAAHALKGAAANLGLSPMLTQLTLLVEPMRTGVCRGLETACAAVTEQQQTLLARLPL